MALPVIDRVLAAEVSRRLSAGQTARAISRSLPVGKTTVLAIAAGRWAPGHSEKTAAAGGELEEPTEYQDRCPRCGAKVKLPCVHCAVVKLVSEGNVPKPVREAFASDPCIELKPHHRARYEEVHAQKVAADPARATSHLSPSTAD